jgi:hypothetical protein
MSVLARDGVELGLVRRSRRGRTQPRLSLDLLDDVHLSLSFLCRNARSLPARDLIRTDGWST